MKSTDLKWHRDFLDLAEWWAERKSKDPSTKVGAIIVGARRVVIGMGYNGFPRGVHDSPDRYEDRETKYQLVAHAEINAILNCAVPPRGATLYCTLAPCHECAKAIIQAGIADVVLYEGSDWKLNPESNRIAMMMFREAGVGYTLIRKAD